MKNIINTFVVFAFISLATLNLTNMLDYLKTIEHIKEIFISQNLGRILAQVGMSVIFIYAAYKIWN